MNRWFLVSGLVAAFGCAGSPPKAVSAVAGLPEYTPEEASLFGDVLQPTVFGLPSELSPAQDPKLPDRVRHADGVVRVRVATVSEEHLAGTNACTIALTVDPKPLNGKAPESPLEIQLGPGSPSLAKVQTEDAQFVGRRFVLFVKRFTHHGEPELHWHGEGDTPALQEAVDRSKALDEVSTRSHTRD